MSKITVNTKNKFTEDIGGRSVFIDSIQLNADIVLEFVFDGGEKEKHSIVAGSKFNSPDRLINEVIFYNANGFDVDIEYHYSSFLIYDEAKVIGDVNALTRFANLTKDGNQFYFGNNMSAIAGNYSMIGIYNPVGSGVMSYLTNMRLSASGDKMDFYSIDSVEYGLGSWIADQSVPNKQLGGAVGKSHFLMDFASAKRGATMTISVSTDSNGTPVPLDFGNAPIEIGEGEGVLLVPASVNTSNTTFIELFEE